MPYLLLLLIFFSSLAHANVLTSIKPLELIVKEVMPEGVVVSTLLSSNASPHDYALKVSDAKKLKEADLFVWIGPGMESFLVSATKRFVSEDKELKISKANGHDGSAHHHDHHGVSQHLWLSYANARDIASDAAERLQDIYPHASEEIDDKLSLFKQRAHSEFESTKSLFLSSGTSPFLVYHDAYQDYVAEFGLHQLDRAKHLPESQLSVHRLVKLKKRSGDAACLLTNIDELKQAQSLANKLELRLIPIDLLGVGMMGDLPPNDFFSYMASIRSSFLACFSEGSEQ